MLEALHKFFEVFGAATVVPAMIFYCQPFSKGQSKASFL